MRLPIYLFCLSLMLAPAGPSFAETAADVATRSLLDALEERQMPDISLAVLDRLEADQDAAPELKKEVPFRRAAALVAVSRTEADSKKRAGYLDEAQKSLDAFLSGGAVSDRQAITAYTQKGNLLIERGRTKAEQANRPGADAAPLRAEALKYFDEAIKSLKGTVKPEEEIKAVKNAEDAVLKVLREVTAKVKAIKDAGKEAPGEDNKAKGRPAKPVRLTPQQQRELDELVEDQEGLQGKLIQTRMAAAAAVFEKAKAYPEKSKEWTDTVAESAIQFKQIADKYPNKGGGLFARYYEGRNYALLGKWEVAVGTLAPLVVLDQRVPLAIMLRSRALNTTLECLLAEKKYDKFDDAARRFALEDVARLPGARLDSEWLGLKYRAAVILDAQADALDPKDAKNRAERGRLQADAKKLATEVAKANADFAAEARAIASKLGKVVAEGERTFAAAMDEAKVSLATMQERLAEVKKATAAKDADATAAAQAAAATARDETIGKLVDAMTLAGLANPLAADPTADEDLKDASIDEINNARYLLTYLLYDGQRYEESAAMGRMLVDRYPNAKGSRQAAKIAMASWQQAAQRSEGEARDAARAKAAELAGVIMRVWPDEAESADAAAIAIGAAVAARDPAAMIAIIGQVPASSPRRGEVLLRAGTALWREVQEARRSDAGTRPDDQTIETWKTKARQAIEDGLASLGQSPSLPAGQLGSLSVAAALSRIQIAMDDNDTAQALAVLEHPAYGPWTLVAAKNPILQQGPLAEAGLTLALRLFIQAEKFDEAQQAMEGLEQIAGEGDESSARLTAMYLSMGRDLQAQLERLGGGKSNDPQVRLQADRILRGFESFLNRVADRDPKISSQFWVATTYLTLGSQKGTAAAAKSATYLGEAAKVYEKLLARASDPEVARFEPSIRLRMANIFRELGKWEEAQQQIDWILTDSKRQNSLDSQIQAAELLQAWAAAAAQAGDSEKANSLYREAAGGRRAEGNPVVIWGWGNIANRLARRGFAGSEENVRQARETFFNARLQVAECLLARATLPGKQAEQPARLESAETAIAMTRRLYPDLGGPQSAKRFEDVLKRIQGRAGKPQAGFSALDQPTAAQEGAQ